jgi:DNA polymerase III subunit delta
MIPRNLEAFLGKEPGGVFYLHGRDEFRKDEAAKALALAHLEAATRDFNLDALRGSEVDVERLASVLGTPPMMAPWRVVLLRETEALASSKGARDLLVTTAKSPPPGLALILVCTVPDRSSARFYRDLAKHARALEFAEMGADDVPGWLMEQARLRHGTVLEEPAARALAQGVGNDLGVLARELEKLTSLVGEGEAVTLAAVEAAGTRVLRQDRWQWFDLVGEGRFREALDGLGVLLEHGESGVGLTLGLATHLLRLGVVADGGQRALEEILPPRQRWLARRYGAQARRWTTEELESALAGLLRVDRLLKASQFSDRHLLESWLLERAASREAA